MDPSMKLTETERELLDRVQTRLLKEGFRISDRNLILSVLKAAAQLSESDLLRLVKQGLPEDGEKRNPEQRARRT